jgi:hypothetical protein
MVNQFHYLIRLLPCAEGGLSHAGEIASLLRAIGLCRTKGQLLLSSGMM